MSQRAIKPLEEPPGELIYSDGEPLDSNWHRIQLTLLIDVVRQAMAERRRQDFFASGDMFLYYSFEQARRIASEGPPKKNQFRGPDVFFVAEKRAFLPQKRGSRTPEASFRTPES